MHVEMLGSMVGVFFLKHIGLCFTEISRIGYEWIENNSNISYLI